MDHCTTCHMADPLPYKNVCRTCYNKTQNHYMKEYRKRKGVKDKEKTYQRDYYQKQKLLKALERLHREAGL